MVLSCTLSFLALCRLHPRSRRVLSADQVYRRVHAQYIYHDGSLNRRLWQRRKKNGVWEDGVSCNIARLTSKKRAIVDVLKNRLVRVNAWQVRRAGIECYQDNQDDHSHCLITGKLTESPASWELLLSLSKKVPYPATWHKRPKELEAIPPLSAAPQPSS